MGLDPDLAEQLVIQRVLHLARLGRRQQAPAGAFAFHAARVLLTVLLRLGRLRELLELHPALPAVAHPSALDAAVVRVPVRLTNAVRHLLLLHQYVGELVEVHLTNKNYYLVAITCLFISSAFVSFLARSATAPVASCRVSGP